MLPSLLHGGEFIGIINILPPLLRFVSIRFLHYHGWLQIKDLLFVLERLDRFSTDVPHMNLDFSFEFIFIFISFRG